MSSSSPEPPAEGTTWPVRALAVVVLVLGVYPLADHLPFAEPQPWWGTAVRTWLLWVPVSVALALLLARLAPSRSIELAERLRRRLLAPSPRRFALGVAALTCTLSLAIGWTMFRWQGATIDEHSQLWQAHILTSGRLFARAEQHPEFFSTMQTVSWQGRWFSHFPIGGPALQAVGLLLRVPWLMNPVLAACAAAAVYRFAAHVGGESEARGTALLFALSPFVLMVAGSRLDHVATLAAIWIALATLPGWLASASDRSARRSAAVIGSCLGLATMIRPYDGIVATLVVGAFQLLSARRAALWRSLVVQAAVGAIPVAVLLATNRVLTGSALTFPYDILNGPDHRPGFHMSPLGYEHTPVTGLYRVSLYLMRLNETLLGWPVPVTALIVIAMAAWRPVTRWDRLLVGFVTATLVAYWLYWGDGSFHGPRFLFAVVPVFLLFVARLPAAVRARIQDPPLRAGLSLLVPFWVLTAWLLPGRLQPLGPWRVMTARDEPELSADLLDTVSRMRLGRALVFVQDGWHARLTARMRAIGMPPFSAQLIVGNYNACTLQQRLDDAERRRLPDAAAAAAVASVMREPLDSRPVPGLTAMEQLALPKSSTVPEACRWDFEHALPLGMDFARLLPRVTFDTSGALDGDIVYARDFGARNELLRDRFPDRTWYVARAEVRDNVARVVVEPYARLGGSAAR